MWLNKEKSSDHNFIIQTVLASSKHVYLLETHQRTMSALQIQIISYLFTVHQHTPEIKLTPSH